jgi:hypothetical protein
MYLASSSLCLLSKIGFPNQGYVYTGAIEYLDIVWPLYGDLL